MRTSQGRRTSPSCRNCCVRRLGNGVKPPPSFLAKLRAGIFWLWFQELDAADMLSCTPKNKSACASSNECECRIHRGSDRSAKSGLARKCFGRIMCESHERPSLIPRRRASNSCSAAEPTVVNPAATSKLEMLVGVAKKPQHLASRLRCRAVA